ncbi:hypothetical protein [Streptomyces sp. NPDC002913]
MNIIKRIAHAVANVIAPRRRPGMEEEAAAVEILCDRLDAIIGRTGHDIAAYVEAPAFGIHAHAYAIALRETAATGAVHDRATAHFVRMLGTGPAPYSPGHVDDLITAAYGIRADH